MLIDRCHEYIIKPTTTEALPQKHTKRPHVGFDTVVLNEYRFWRQPSYVMCLEAWFKAYEYLINLINYACEEYLIELIIHNHILNFKSSICAHDENS